MMDLEACSSSVHSSLPGHFVLDHSECQEIRYPIRMLCCEMVVDEELDTPTHLVEKVFYGSYVHVYM